MAHLVSNKPFMKYSQRCCLGNRLLEIRRSISVAILEITIGIAVITPISHNKCKQFRNSIEGGRLSPYTDFYSSIPAQQNYPLGNTRVLHPQQGVTPYTRVLHPPRLELGGVRV